MLYQKAKIKNGKIVITESKQVDQSTLTAECWIVQIEGLGACEKCEFKDTEECGGKEIRKKAGKK